MDSCFMISRAWKSYGMRHNMKRFEILVCVVNLPIVSPVAAVSKEPFGPFQNRNVDHCHMRCISNWR